MARDDAGGRYEARSASSAESPTAHGRQPPQLLKQQRATPTSTPGQQQLKPPQRLRRGRRGAKTKEESTVSLRTGHWLVHCSVADARQLIQGSDEWTVGNLTAAVRSHDFGIGKLLDDAIAARLQQHAAMQPLTQPQQALAGGATTITSIAGPAFAHCTGESSFEERILALEARITSLEQQDVTDGWQAWYADGGNAGESAEAEDQSCEEQGSFDAEHYTQQQHQDVDTGDETSVEHPVEAYAHGAKADSRTSSNIGSTDAGAEHYSQQQHQDNNPCGETSVEHPVDSQDSIYEQSVQLTALDEEACARGAKADTRKRSKIGSTDAEARLPGLAHDDNYYTESLLCCVDIQHPEICEVVAWEKDGITRPKLEAFVLSYALNTFGGNPLPSYLGNHREFSNKLALLDEGELLCTPHDLGHLRPSQPRDLSDELKFEAVLKKRFGG
mmetsp:Transcript_112564/g.223750  ORF Transcript_112564/g.223750 Transcript_112564/m.223750 type:complete len:444 (+) Transcript_112564:63-1394(+)